MTEAKRRSKATIQAEARLHWIDTLAKVAYISKHTHLPIQKGTIYESRTKAIERYVVIRNLMGIEFALTPLIHIVPEYWAQRGSMGWVASLALQICDNTPLNIAGIEFHQFDDDKVRVDMHLVDEQACVSVAVDMTPKEFDDFTDRVAKLEALEPLSEEHDDRSLRAAEDLGRDAETL